MTKLTDTAVRYLVAITFGLIVICLIGAGVYSSKQDEVYIETYTTYQRAITLVQENKFEEAIPLFKQLEKKQPDSPVIKHYLAISLSNTGDFSAAVTKFQNVIDLNPYKVEDSLFMLQFGEILLFSGKKEEAKIVLERCLTLEPPLEMPDYHEKVKLRLAELN